MASSLAAAPSTSGTAPTSTLAAKAVDASLWWESFVVLAEELERSPLSDDQLPPRLAEKVKRNHGWFLDSVTRFRRPNTVSRLALDSSEVTIGLHVLAVNPEIKKASLRISEYLCLDEVQSYILASRLFDVNKSAGVEDREFLHQILLRYYLERQCLLKCIRHIFVNALQTNSGSSSNRVFKSEALKLVEDGLEKKLSSIFEDLLTSIYSDNSEVNLTIPWMEEVLIEDNLVLDIMFLTYYENFCSCNSQQWKSLCSLFKRTLCGSLNIEHTTVSIEAKNLFSHTKAKLLLILVETLDLENILQMVHDEAPLRQGCAVFSPTDILDIDAQISTFFGLGVPEVGPLILVWAVFLCLLLSLPEANNNFVLMEIDHMTYVRQAFQLSTFHYLLEMIGSDMFRDTDGPLSGFLSVVRTFISAFIAAYEPLPQTEDNSFIKVLDIICQIYDGEESLSMQFWDKGSFIDGPIRSILFTLEKEYPSHIYEFLRFLSAVGEGTWPAECVYNYLDNMSGITMLFEVPDGTDALAIDDEIEVPYELQVPDIEGLTIPRGTHGYIVKVVDSNLVLVRWEEAVEKIFQRALQYCDPERIHWSLLGVYERTEQHELAFVLLERMAKRFKNLCEVWVSYVKNLLKQQKDGIQSVIDCALLSLPHKKHIRFLSETAILEFKHGIPDRGRSMFESILREYPKRTDLWSIYLDQEIHMGNVEVTRALFERATCLSLPPKKMKFLLKKFLEYESSHGDEERIEYVKKKALEYVECFL